MTDNKVQFHPNSNDSWESIRSLYGTHNAHNVACGVNSVQCSQEMSKYPVCRWHHARMARWMNKQCGCKDNDVCDGDALGRMMFCQYYQIEKITVIDCSGRWYCCGECQNTDTQVYRCGDLMICEDCVSTHDQQTIKKISDD